MIRHEAPPSTGRTKLVPSALNGVRATFAVVRGRLLVLPVWLQRVLALFVFSGVVVIVCALLWSGSVAMSDAPFWIILISLLVLCIGSVWFALHQRNRAHTLHQQLLNEHQFRNARLAEYDRTTRELRQRMRELHTLEEGLRIITSKLSIEEVLDQMADSTLQLFGSQRVYGIALSLTLNGQTINRTYMQDGSADSPWVADLTREVLQRGVPVLISDTEQYPDSGHFLRAGLRSVLGVPLFVSDDRGPRGALTVVSEAPAAFSSSDTRHLVSFATQAGIAIANAELHTSLRLQERLLQSVVHDISDGLLVVNVADQAVVLSNPIAHQVLYEGDTKTAALNQLFALALECDDRGDEWLMQEVRVTDTEEEGPERIYQAVASSVRQGDDNEERLVAIILHDITEQMHFFSMVAHELRKPLTSLSGFVKVILRGQAGPLTPLQSEFLQIADEQGALLNGRIEELLQFYRMKAGKMSIEPQLNDLSLLIAGVVSRLRLQAEQKGLTLTNLAMQPVPEFLFDNERIGQVLTNLIDNAIKATPPGGVINVNAVTDDGHVQISVKDTGIGIPESEQRKIFSRFFQATNNHVRSSDDKGLGLGLAICQMIVEGHNGEIMVESQEGLGSCFSIRLPLILELDDEILAQRSV